MTAESRTMQDHEALERRLDQFRAFWRGELRMPRVSFITDPSYRQATDAETMVAEACRCIRADIEADRPDVLPTLIPDFGTVSMPAIWGGRVIRPSDGGNVHIEPLAETPAELNLGAPRPLEQTDFGRAVELYERVRERLGADRLFVRTPDLQGPLNTLALLVDQTELMCAMHEEPQSVHDALDRITETQIDILRRYYGAVGATNVVGNVWPWVCLPGDMGICITQDYMPLISPEAYATFELPRLRRIAEAFGGVMIHCCGEYARHAPTLRDSGIRIWGLEVHYPYTAVWDLYEVFGDDVVYVPYVAEGQDVDLAGFADRLAGMPCGRGRYWFSMCPGWIDETKLRTAAEALGVPD